MSNQLREFRRLAAVCENFVVLDQVGSTNEWLRSHAPNDDGSVIVITDNQSEGRGRLDRSWVSRPGESLALSIGLPWSLASGDGKLSWLPLVAGATLVQTLRSCGIEGVSLKWPNDVLVDDAKLAGILCEFQEPGRVIIGLGLNLAFALDDPPSPNATALAHHGNFSPDVLDELLASVVAAIRDWVAGGGEDVVSAPQSLVASVMGSIGRRIKVQELGGASWTGLARGLDESGHLLVQADDSSELRVVVASDIEHLYQ
jgi:BirA family biotin operon repressor/biotin-[acetyl-CoA-carboxylase] ligase